jgi:primosomal protein N' (replication factor Y)
VSIGTESLQEEVVGIVGDQNVISVDDDINLDEAETAILIENIKKKKSFVMIGTQKLLPFIKGVDFIAIPFFDRILSVPSPFVVEETLRLLIECNEYVKENLIICTKNPEFTITKQLATKKINSIISDDLESRKILKYPPFGILLKISITIPNGQSVAINDKIHDFFHLYDVTKMPMRKINHIGNKLLGVWIIQINDNFLEDHSNNLRNFLENTHLPYKIDIDPHRF